MRSGTRCAGSMYIHTRTHGFFCAVLDRQNDKLKIYNLSRVGSDREWLQDVLLSDMETESEPSDEDEYVRDMLRQHVKEKKVRDRYYRNPHVCILSCIVDSAFKYAKYVDRPHLNTNLFLYRTPNMATMVRVFYQTPTYITSINEKSLASQRKPKRRKSVVRPNTRKPRRSTPRKRKRTWNRVKLIGTMKNSLS